jgi:hypothetical protein
MDKAIAVSRVKPITASVVARTFIGHLASERVHEKRASQITARSVSPTTSLSYENRQELAILPLRDGVASLGSRVPEANLLAALFRCAKPTTGRRIEKVNRPHPRRRPFRDLPHMLAFSVASAQLYRPAAIGFISGVGCVGRRLSTGGFQPPSVAKRQLEAAATVHHSGLPSRRRLSSRKRR